MIIYPYPFEVDVLLAVVRQDPHELANIGVILRIYHQNVLASPTTTIDMCSLFRGDGTLSILER